MAETAAAQRESVYLTCAETAKLVRVALKQAFPGVKFSVRSSTYSMGASIDVTWTDGPRAMPVAVVCNRFEGADFDGSIDLKAYRTHYLLPDGTVGVLHAEGTEGSMGRIPAFDQPLPEGARPVRLGADSVTCHRKRSRPDERYGEAFAYIVAHCATQGEGATARFGIDYVDHLAWRMVGDQGEGEDWEPSFRRIVLRESDA